MILIIIILNNKYKLVLKVDIEEHGAYYSEPFVIKNEIVSISSNQDFMVEIYIIQEEDEKEIIGYISPNKIEHVQLNKDKRYRIKVNKKIENLELSISKVMK